MIADAPTTLQGVKPSLPAEGTRADQLVVFGITGDLAKVMTFRSLYRLEKRGLLDCPILGVAFDDWSLDRGRVDAALRTVAALLGIER